ncbi:MAG: 50S ribosomal protein L17 [Firmicutes bacterium]|nr:50S ribosomal protein L17 [Candidatus Alectryobacillus merdavium]
MATIGRKNVHGKGGVRFKTGFTSSKHKNLLRNVLTDLVVYEKVSVTTSVVKDLVKKASHLITLAKRGDLHARRQAISLLRNKMVDEKTSAVDKLFNDLVKRFDGVNGGYVRVLKLAPRKGDGAEVRLVTWSK